MVSAKVSALVGATLVSAASAAAGVKSTTMGPAAMMWPADRVWSDAADNTEPCGSTAGVGNRTPFPLQNGKISLVTQDSISALHIAVSTEKNPTSASDFETFFNPQQVGTVGVGHTCLSIGDMDSSVKAGDVGTFQIMYSYQPEGAEKTFHYACSDVTFVEVANFNDDTRCFNSTLENPELTVDSDHRVTTTDSEGKNPHDAETFTAKSGLGAGPIAGAVVGAVAGLGLIGAAVFFFRRRNAQKKKEQEQMREVEEKAHSDTLSTRS